MQSDWRAGMRLGVMAEEQKVDGKSLFFMDADYNLLPFEMQMRYNLMTDIMIGPHGAGLTHQVSAALPSPPSARSLPHPRAIYPSNDLATSTTLQHCELPHLTTLN